MEHRPWGSNARNVTKRFGYFLALDDVTVEIPSGSLTALLGPSGGGKSTLLRVMAGLEPPDTGVVELDGIDATRLPPQRRNVGFVFQHYAAFKHMTVFRNVAFGLEIRKRPKDEIRRRVTELLELVHLEAFADRMPAQLSGGQRQRMALARALAVEPSVLLLDEPFGALDAQVRKELRNWLRRLHDEMHVTTVFVTHDQEEAMDVADRIVVMANGRVEQIGTPDELYDRPANAVRHELPRSGHPPRRRARAPARSRGARRAGRGHGRGPGAPRRPPRASRCASTSTSTMRRERAPTETRSRMPTCRSRATPPSASTSLPAWSSTSGLPAARSPWPKPVPIPSRRGRRRRR